MQETVDYLLRRRHRAGRDAHVGVGQPSRSWLVRTLRRWTLHRPRIRSVPKAPRAPVKREVDNISCMPHFALVSAFQFFHGQPCCMAWRMYYIMYSPIMTSPATKFFSLHSNTRLRQPCNDDFVLQLPIECPTEIQDNIYRYLLFVLGKIQKQHL